MLKMKDGCHGYIAHSQHFTKKGTTTTVKQAFCNMEQMHNNELVT
jgi:hypothetical protein